MIIVEGPDGGGKSTLCRQLHERLKYPFAHSGGPPKSAQDLFDRNEMCLESSAQRIWDRVPCISDPIYSRVIRNVETPIQSVLADSLDKLCAKSPLLIYCRPTLGASVKVMEGHDIKAHETSDHVDGVKANQLELCYAYDVSMSHLHRMGFNLLEWYWPFTTAMDFDTLVGVIEECFGTYSE